MSIISDKEGLPPTAPKVLLMVRGRRRALAPNALKKLDRGQMRACRSADPSRYSARTFTFAALPIVSRLRNGRPKASASISNTSPFSVLTPSLNDSVAVPK
jgi:hypothetical protein